MRLNAAWPDRDDELKQLCADPLLTYREIGKRMGLPTDAVIGRAYRQGYREPLTAETRAALIVARSVANHGGGWTADRIQKLREACDAPDMGWVERGAYCGVSSHSARQKARDLGLVTRRVRIPKPPAPKRDKPNPRPVDFRVRTERPKPISASDAELIAQHLETKGVTVCKPGWAFGCDQIQYVGKSWKAA